MLLFRELLPPHGMSYFSLYCDAVGAFYLSRQRGLWPSDVSVCFCVRLRLRQPQVNTLFIKGDASLDQAGIIVFAGGLEHCQNLLHGNGNEHSLAGGYLSSVLWRCA